VIVDQALAEAYHRVLRITESPIELQDCRIAGANLQIQLRAPRGLQEFFESAHQGPTKPFALMLR